MKTIFRLQSNCNNQLVLWKPLPLASDTSASSSFLKLKERHKAAKKEKALSLSNNCHLTPLPDLDVDVFDDDNFFHPNDIEQLPSSSVCNRKPGVIVTTFNPLPKDATFTWVFFSPHRVDFFVDYLWFSSIHTGIFHD